MVPRTLALALVVISREAVNDPHHAAPAGGIVSDGGNGWTALTRDLPGMECTVSMLANDWSGASRAHAIEEALGAVIERARTSGAT